MYGSKIWDGCSGVSLQRILKLQKRAACIILNADRLTPSIPLFNSLNGPFAASGHMVQNPPCWRASCPLGHPEQSNFIKINLHFLCFGCPSV